MATSTAKLAIDRSIQSTLDALRWRIRLYVLLEGLSLALIWLGSTFWISLALDYLPVLMGASEMPAAARGILLVITSGVLAYLLYRFIGRRLFVALPDRSMALLLERQFQGFDESLVTTVELSGDPSHAEPFNQDMLRSTIERAQNNVDHVRYRRVFNNGPLYLRLFLGAILVLSIVLFSAFNREALAKAAERIYLLSDDPWPRSSHIEVLGIEVQRTPGPDGSTPPALTVPFENNLVKVAKGSNVRLKVRADLAPKARVVPQACTIYYHTLKTGEGDRNERGSVQMTNYRDTDDGRNFAFDGKPFKGVLATIAFDVVGYDHRVRDYRLEVVDSPSIVETLLDLTFPPYMVDVATSNHLPVRDQQYLPSGTFIPLGTEVVLKFRANKPLQRAEIVDSTLTDAQGQPSVTIIEPKSQDRERFEYRIGKLAGNVTLEISLFDTDNVATDRPFRVFLSGIEDQPPQVDVTLKGIGTAVTPDVLVPFRGKVADDYAVNETWFEVQVNDNTEPRQMKFPLGKSGAVEEQIDFRQERASNAGIELKPQDKLTLVVKASDKYNLASDPHVGAGDRYQLDVVTPAELLAQLEVREVGLRRRFEQILDEMQQMRDSLLRVKSSLVQGSVAGAEPEDLRAEDADGQTLTPEKLAQRAAELRVLRVQRAIQQGEKSKQEILGVAGGFEIIREELINNRVDTEDRKKRLKDEIADPLTAICATDFPSLDEQLNALEKNLRDAGVKPPADSAPLADATLERANETIEKLEKVLEKMQDLETYNELIDIVRSLLKDQEDLIDRTKQERKRQVLEDLQ
jgi:hypothetical protein